MSRKRPRSPSAYPAPAPVPAPALEIENIFSRILVRVADPASLASASLVNKSWYDLIVSSYFLDRFRERQHTRLVGFFSESDGGREFVPLPLPPELRWVSRFLLEVFPDGLHEIQDIFSGYILCKLDGSVGIFNPFAKMIDILPLCPRFRHVGASCGDFYLFNEDNIIHVDVVTEDNLIHVQMSVYRGNWIQNSTTAILQYDQNDEPLCRPALCVDGFVYMLSVSGFVVKVKIDDCSISLIALPNGSYEWGFQQICRSNSSDFRYVHVDGFSIQIWSWVLDKWTPVNSVYLPYFFGKHVEAERTLSSIQWNDSRSGWGEFVTIYGTTDDADYIFMGINGLKDLFLLDIMNEDVFKIGQKESTEMGELIGNCISPYVTGWVP